MTIGAYQQQTYRTFVMHLPFGVWVLEQKDYMVSFVSKQRYVMYVTEFCMSTKRHLDNV